MSEEKTFREAYATLQKHAQMYRIHAQWIDNKLWGELTRAPSRPEADRRER